MPNREVFSVKEAAKYLHVSESAIRNLKYQKGIPFFTIGAKILFDRESIDKWILEKEKQNSNEVEPEGYRGLKVAR